MIALGTHWEFIAGGYVASALVVFALIAWTLLDGQRQRTRVAVLEAQRERSRVQ